MPLGGTRRADVDSLDLPPGPFVAGGPPAHSRGRRSLRRTRGGIVLDHEDFGRYLTQQRELRGMSREEVSSATRISPALITALEDGQVERLPARVFVINYIRSYAQVIGLAPDEAVLRFEEIAEADAAIPTPAALERRRVRKALLILGGVALLVLLGVYLLLAVSGHVPGPFAPG